MADRRDHMVIMGMMGAGKTTVGRLVAGRLNRRFVDVDAEVVRRSGRSVAELFAEEGERAFRDLESQCLAEALDTDEDTVVAVGGGAVLDPVNRRRMAHCPVVAWLRARPETLAGRVVGGAGRPLLEHGGDGVLLRLTTLATERAPLYEQLATLVVDVDGLSAGHVADRLCALVGTPS